jgi:hypothetical protein
MAIAFSLLLYACLNPAICPLNRSEAISEAGPSAALFIFIPELNFSIELLTFLKLSSECRNVFKDVALLRILILFSHN